MAGRQAGRQGRRRDGRRQEASGGVVRHRDRRRPHHQDVYPRRRGVSRRPRGQDGAAQVGLGDPREGEPADEVPLPAHRRQGAAHRGQVVHQHLPQLPRRPRGRQGVHRLPRLPGTPQRQRRPRRQRRPQEGRPLHPLRRRGEPVFRLHDRRRGDPEGPALLARRAADAREGRPQGPGQARLARQGRPRRPPQRRRQDRVHGLYATHNEADGGGPRPARGLARGRPGRPDLHARGVRRPAQGVAARHPADQGRDGGRGDARPLGGRHHRPRQHRRHHPRAGGRGDAQVFALPRPGQGGAPGAVARRATRR